MRTISHDEGGMTFTTEVDGHRAHLDYTLVGSVMTIIYTRVPKPIEGRGIAAQLMSAALEVARSKTWSVNPACAYAVSYLQKHPQTSPDLQLENSQHGEDLLDEALDESFPASDSPSVGASS